MGLSLSCIRGNSKNEPIEPLRIVPEAQEVPAQVEITELCDLTEKLIEKDENNCAKYIKYNVQNRRNGNKDTCKYPLFSKVDDNMYQLPTVKAFIALTDNFNPDVTKKENATIEKKQEEINFIDAIMATEVMNLTMDFLIAKNLIKNKNTFKELLHRMWFANYPRSHWSNIAGSCAFEHIFLGEVKNGKVIGFHNWLYFLLEEQKGNLNYYGFSKHFDFGQDGRYRGGILKSTFKWHGHKKPISTMFVGFSPELELAIYTLAVLVKPDGALDINLGGKIFQIKTHMLQNDSKKYLAGAYVDF